MVKLTVYGSPIATCTQRVLILLEELQLKYDLQEVDLMKGQQKEKKYLELQPFGKVPVVIYDEHTIFESRTILRYIAKNNTDDLDLTLDSNVDVDMWLEVESQNFNPPISKFVYEKVFKKWKDPEAKSDENVLSQALEELNKVLSVYEKRLENSKYLGGEKYSIADISHIPYLNLFVKSGSDYKNFLKNYPRVYKWFKRMMAREAVQYVLN